SAAQFFVKIQHHRCGGNAIFVSAEMSLQCLRNEFDPSIVGIIPRSTCPNLEFSNRHIIFPAQRGKSLMLCPCLHGKKAVSQLCSLTTAIRTAVPSAPVRACQSGGYALHPARSK